jgi:hypothetical protein
MNWIWLNMPLGALIFLATAGIPLWMVIKHPDAGPEPEPARRTARPPARVPAYAAASPRTWMAATQHRAEQRRHAGGQLVSAR